VGRILAVALALVAFAAAPALAGSQGRAEGVQRSAALDSRLLAQVNAVRARHGLAALHVSRQLAAAAAQHSTQMAQLGYFSHDSAHGVSFASRLRSFYPAGGHRRWSVGENLLWASPSMDAPGAVALWMGSPGHRENLLSPRWREIGIAAVHAASAPGVYGGQEVTIVTVDFGLRR
jgi:uncharacterized protein YkwD